MGIYKIYPSKDATLYSEYPSMNTGLDEIIEASTYLKDDQGQSCRYLIQFSQDEINNVFDTHISKSGIFTRSYNVYLKNYAAVVTNLNQSTTVEILPVSCSWDMGMGRYLNSPETQIGCSWKWRDESGSRAWITSGFEPLSNGYSVSGKEGGGTWWTGSTTQLDITSSQVFTYSNPIDIEQDVTNITSIWISQSKGITGGDITNDGFLIKQINSNEFIPSESKAATLKYYSVDTNTIYPPHLEFRFDDYSWDTGSSTNTILSSAESFISVYNNAGTYYSQSVARLRLAARPKYPTRTFATSSIYTTNYYLPISSSYAIKDSETNEYVIDFDKKYTQISADANSSYFDVYMNGLEPERYYTILIKTELDNTTKVFDENITFKVING
jgi:hypothetical protein